MRTNPPDRRSHVRHRYGVRAGSIQDSSWNLIVRAEESASGQTATFGPVWRSVWNAAANRRSSFDVGSRAVEGKGRLPTLRLDGRLPDGAAAAFENDRAGIGRLIRWIGEGAD